MSCPAVFDPGSFRDRSGRVLVTDSRVLRAMSAPAWADWGRVHAAPFLQRETQAGRIVSTAVSSRPPAGAAGPPWAGWLEHERIPFITYPYEWPWGMLRDAAILQLDLMQGALADGFILKDASPFNIQFRGVDPVFIDVGSFERHDGGPWAGYRQFCQMFLYPLMLQAWRGIDFQPWLRGRLAGITPQECWRMLSFRDLLRRGALSHVFLHSKLAAGLGGVQDNLPQSMRASGFQKTLTESLVRKLRRVVSGLKWSPHSSYWSDYDRAAAPVQQDAAAKEAFVRKVCQHRRWRSVWDLGCNVGRYSRIASEHSDLVLALDVDHLAVERLYAGLRQEGRRNILPLVFNLADPSPALGWRGSERKDLSSRGRPELVLCLALIHHLVLRENLLLPDVIDWLARLGGTLVIEFVDKADPQARSLLANRIDQYDDYTAEQFTSCLESRFTIHQREVLPSGTRTLFLAEPRQGADA